MMHNSKIKGQVPRPLHRPIAVGEENMISLCETCSHMPQGRVPQNNFDKQNGIPEKPFMYCRRKAYFPDINYSNEGKPFYDVAKCDGYDRLPDVGKNGPETKSVPEAQIT